MRLTAGRCSCTACTSVPMKRAISSTAIHAGPGACCCCKREILRLFGLVKQQGLTLIPLSVYFKGSLVKVQVGLCRGKKLYDKREDAARRDMKREADRAFKERNS